MPQWPRLPQPELAYDAGGAPASQHFNDIYFNPADGIAESEYVFLTGIGAPDCWRDRHTFTIGETGFGTGLNFLLTWSMWKRTAPAGSVLNYIAVEGYPLDRDQLHTALQPFAGLSPLTASLLDAYPVRHGGFHRLIFENGRVTLTLLFGDVEIMLNRLTGRIDAWFLDGFAPARNPAMWSDAVLGRIACLSAPNAAFATFTAAGHVRRGLQAAGFGVSKTPGFGRKKERLVGRLDRRPTEPDPHWSTPPPALAAGSRIAVIGSGIAGSSAAHSLRIRGFDVTVFDDGGAPGGGMTGNPAVILSPKPPAEASLAGRLNAVAFIDSIRRYEALHLRTGDIWIGPRSVDALSTSPPAADRRARALSVLGWPKSIACMVNDPALSPFPIARFAQSGCIDPVAACRALNADVREANVTRIDETDTGWRLTDGDGRTVWTGDAVVVAAGACSTRLAGLAQTPLYTNRGQVSLIDPDSLPGVPANGFSFDGYLSPAVTVNGKTVRVLGSSFASWRDLADQDWRLTSETDHDVCLNALHQAIARPRPMSVRPVGLWAGLRAAPPDRVPLVGAVCNETDFLERYADLRNGRDPATNPPYRKGLYILAGLGARGYQLGPLLGDVIADLIAGTPPALEKDVLEAINPARFLARGLKRGEESFENDAAAE